MFLCDDLLCPSGELVAEKKHTDYFPELEYRYFPIIFEEKSIEGIQGPVYQPSGRIMNLGEADRIEPKSDAGEIFHEESAGVYEDSGKQFKLGEKEVENWDEESPKEKVYGTIPCPKCGGHDRFHCQRGWFFCRQCYPLSNGQAHDIFGFYESSIPYTLSLNN